jgi:hypothetical protein
MKIEIHVEGRPVIKFDSGVSKIAAIDIKIVNKEKEEGIDIFSYDMKNTLIDKSVIRRN